MSLADWFKNNFDNATNQAGSILPPGYNVRARLVAPKVAPTREEFATWRDNPITEFVMAALVRNAEECREQWINHSWDNGIADQAELIALRERSDALLGFTADYDAFCETLGLEPQPLEVEDAA